MNTPDETECTVDAKDIHSIVPDGGLTAWLTVLGAFLIQVAGFGFVNAFGVFQDYYSQHYLTNVSSSSISWIGSVDSFLILSGGLFFGRLYDTGYFYWLVIGGCSLQVLCLFMLSLVQQNQFYQIFLSHGLGFGLATSMSYVPSLAVVSHHFDKRLAIAMSIAIAGAPIGSAGYSILLDNLLNGNLGFPNSIRIAAATNTVLVLIGCALMRTRPLYPKTHMPYSQLLKTSSADYPYIFATIGCAANNLIRLGTTLIPF
jgi:predicted MFS family arabinose efflux permease